jgi:hypothetical protein
MEYKPRNICEFNNKVLERKNTIKIRAALNILRSKAIFCFSKMEKILSVGAEILLNKIRIIIILAYTPDSRHASPNIIENIKGPPKNKTTNGIKENRLIRHVNFNTSRLS